MASVNYSPDVAHRTISVLNNAGRRVNPLGSHQQRFLPSRGVLLDSRHDLAVGVHRQTDGECPSISITTRGEAPWMSSMVQLTGNRAGDKSLCWAGLGVARV